MVKQTSIIVSVVLIVVLLGLGYWFISGNNNDMKSMDMSGSTQNPPGPPSLIEQEINTDSSSHEIAITGFAFSPASLNVKVGDTVVWSNQDNAIHTVTSDSGSELSSSNMAAGDSYSHTFTQAGTYKYHCAIHGGMKGTIIVS